MYWKPLLAFVTVFVVAFISGYLYKGLTYETDTGTVAGVEQTEARPGERRGYGPGDRRAAVNRIADYLELRDNQSDLFFERIGEYRNEMQNVVSQKREAEHAAMVEIYKEMRNELSAILDADQLEKMDIRFHPDNVREMQQRRSRDQVRRRSIN